MPCIARLERYQKAQNSRDKKGEAKKKQANTTNKTQKPEVNT